MALLNINLADSGSPYTSSDLLEGDVYTRDDLISAYNIKDATINTGVFRPAGKKSIWLFVTEIKSLDKTQYHDKLCGNTLTWQGQTSGRTDALIIEHKLRDDELVVFYRKHKLANPAYGFIYQGVFRYESHQGSRPATFTLKRI